MKPDAKADAPADHSSPTGSPRFEIRVLGLLAVVLFSIQFPRAVMGAELSVAPPGLIDQLRDPNWERRVVSGYRGDIDIESANSRALIGEIAYVTGILNATSKPCGANIRVFTPVSQTPTRIMVITIVADGSVASVKSAVDPFFEPDAVKITTKESDVVADAAKQLSSADYSVTSIDVPGVPSSAIVLSKSSGGLHAEPYDTLDLAIFAGLTALTPPNTDASGGPFAYLRDDAANAGTLDEASRRFVQLCVASALVRGVCEGTVSSAMSSDDMTSQSGNVLRICQPGSPLIQKLRNIDQKFIQAGSK